MTQTSPQFAHLHPPLRFAGWRSDVGRDLSVAAECRLRADCVDKRFGEGKRAILIQEGSLARNIDSKSATSGFDSCGSLRVAD